MLIIGALFAAFVVWASFAEVDEIARGDGKVIPASKTQIVQASEAGVVQEIAVKIGQTSRRTISSSASTTRSTPPASASSRPRRAP